MTNEPELRFVYGDVAGLEAIRQGFNRGFSDYKYGAILDLAAIQSYLDRSAIDPANCAVVLAYEEGLWIGAGVALLALEGDEGWCGGLAVAPAYRRRRAAERLMVMLHRQAQRRGAAQLRLEVLAENSAARALYARLGYEQVRELLIWERSHDQGMLPAAAVRLEAAEPSTVLDTLYQWHDLPLAWQRRRAYLHRMRSQMAGVTISTLEGQSVAYALYYYRPSVGNGASKVQVLDIAVDPAGNIADAGRLLLQALQREYVEADLTLVNEPADSVLSPILESLGFQVTERQFELVRRLA